LNNSSTAAEQQQDYGYSFFLHWQILWNYSNCRYICTDL